MCTKWQPFYLALLLPALGASAWTAEMKNYPLTPVSFTEVRLTDPVLAPRIELNRTVTLPHCLRQCEQTGRIANFEHAAFPLGGGAFVGYAFNDSDVFKVMEGAAYVLATAPDAQLDEYLDNLILKVADAQEPDGYLYTARTLGRGNPPAMCGPDRWSNLKASHELYNVGHLYEAAVAHTVCTGKESLLQVALINAELILKEFGPHARHDVPGHQEIELALIKLARQTQREEFLALARFFLDQRGQADNHILYGEYAQDHLPVLKQDKPIGHAVRAGYMYAAMADLAAATGETAYVAALDRLWQNSVSTKLYLTGGIGARAGGESFGDDYELPNAAAYAETCAAIANIFWNQRLFQLHGDAKYVDIVERVLYNGFLSGIALGGDRFFYVNPLASRGEHERQPWFACACCPSNVVRFVPTIPSLVYASSADTVFVNLFAAGRARLQLGERTITLTQQTRYPWDGRVRILVESEQPTEFTLAIRIPGWALGRPVPSDLYRYAAAPTEKPTVALNREAVALELDRGYVRLKRTWQRGDIIDLSLPMPVNRVLAHEAVKANAGRVALERGPLVYCAEAVDNGGHAQSLVLADDTQVTARHDDKLLGGVTVLRAPAHALQRGADGQTIESAPVELVAIPYFAWCNRGAGAMAVWLARDRALAEPAPLPTVASRAKPSASHVHDTLRALNDLLDPKDSCDHEIPRFTWWDRRGTTEWVQYDFAEPTNLSGVEVFWFDDQRSGGACRVPAAWRVLVKSGADWTPVAASDETGVQPDQFNVLRFDTFETTAVRLEVRLQPKYSGGILEWRVK